MDNGGLFPLQGERIESKNLKRILSQYLRYWYLFLIGLVISVGTAFLYLRYNSETHYQVVTRLLIKDEKSGSDLSSSTAFNDLGMLNATKNTDNEILVLKSKTLMTRVVRALDLGVNYFYQGQFKDIELYGKELPLKVIVLKAQPNSYGKEFVINIKDNNLFELTDPTGQTSSHQFGKQVATSYGTFTVILDYNKKPGDTSDLKEIKFILKNLDNVANQYHKSIVITQVNKNSSVISLELTDPKPEKAADILNKIVQIYNQEAIEDKNAIAANTIKFIDERLIYLTSEISGVEKNVEQFKSQNEVTDVTEQASVYLDQANTYNKQLSDWAIQIDVLKSLENYLINSKNQFQIVPSSLGLQDQTLTILVGKFNELQLERERMLRTANPNSPLIQNLDDQMQNLRTNILENLGNIKRSLVITSNRIKAQSSQFKDKIKRAPSMERELLEINRQQSIKQNLYLYLLQKREETALSQAASISHSRTIDPAMVQGFSILPNQSTFYLMAIILGLALPFAAIYIHYFFNDNILTKEDVELATSTPILGEICHNRSSEYVVVTKGNRTPIVEMFRHIRAKLHFAAIDKENKVILITSSMSGEGKSFFSINLAASLSHTGKKVLLIDLDLRKPKLAQELDLPKGAGVSDYLVSNRVPINDIIRTTEKAPDLFLITSGPLPPDPTEMMMSPKLGLLINELKKSFDYILLDSAPVGLVADAFSLSQVADSTIFLVRYNYTSKKQLRIIEGIHKEKTLPRAMIVMNDAKLSGRAGYGYGYGYGNESEKAKMTEVNTN